MNYKLLTARLILATSVAAVFMLYRSPVEKVVNLELGRYSYLNNNEEEGEEKEKAAYTKERWLHEFEMLRNPVTGKIPDNYREMELAVAKGIPEKGRRSTNPFLPGIMGVNDVTVQNNYISIGPNNVSGRSRTLGIDRRNANIMITGGTTGGIFRSTNGGSSWTFVSPENDIRSANSIVQDPLNPDVWYCGTGEAYYPVSTADVSNATYGFGIYKSVNNGVTWTKLAFTIANNNEHAFDNAFDLVHRMAVHPTTGHVYAASHRRVMRSTDGGATWTAVLEGTSPTSAIGGITEVIIPSNGSRIYAAVTGENPDRAFVGIWESATGAANSWVRIAGGVQNATDSVPGWRPYGTWGRIVLALNGTNNKLFALYKNGESASGTNPKPEADLYRADLTGTAPGYAWTNLNAYVPDEPNFNREGIDPYTTQFNGFNMSLAVKPDNENVIFVGGTNLHRVLLTETDPAKKFTRIGGYGEGFFPQDEFFIYQNHHPDIHGIYFHSTSNDQLYTASDGGIHKTSTSVMADTVRWSPLNTSLQTLQYQFVNINPIPEGNLDFIIGSAQDNGTLVNLNFQSSDQNLREKQFSILSGDGASSAVGGFTKTGANWKQYWFASVSSGAVYRYEVDLNTTAGEIGITNFDEITPTGLGGAGQWLTMFVNDPDSTEHVYYNNRDRLWRTKTASTVTPSTWTEITGVAATVPANNDFTAMAISKKRNNLKYLFFATQGGRVYRLDNANLAEPTATPVEITPPTMREGSYVAGIALNPRNADTALVVVSNYDQGTVIINNIFWSGNATSATPTWQVLDGALGPVSSQSCAIVVTTAGVEYYVGTSVGLYSTTTLNGNNTQWFNEGGGMMKRAIIRSLVNRQRDNTLVVGTHGNGGFIAKIGNPVNLDVATGINNPITNDSRFIRSVYPTVTRNTVNYTIGNLFSIRRISVLVYNQKGQLVYQQDKEYNSGNINLTNLAAGNYILNITSSDGKYRHVQKIIKH